MQWIEAIDRLPENNKSVNAKINNGGNHYIPDHGFFNALNLFVGQCGTRELKDVLWLDESVSSLWIDVDIAEPKIDGYFKVKFDDGSEDEKPFRIRPSKNIRGFMTENNVTHWSIITDAKEY